MKPLVSALVVSLVLAGPLAACSGDDDTADPTTTTTTSTSPTTADADTPATGVLASDDPRAAEIVEIVEQAVPELALQSVVFGVWVGDDEIVRGAIDAPSPQPATAIDAAVRVGQPLEAMLGTILLQLGDEGVLDLDAPVADVLPDLVNADRITPRMLANSTGGTPDYVTVEAFGDRVMANPFAGYTFDELLGYAQQGPPLFEPGTSWAYSHTEMAALVEVLEAASGESFEELLRTRIFEPLDMTHSMAQQNNAISEPAFHAFTNMRGVYEDSTFWDPTWGLNGGVNASIADLGRWLRALNDGELLDDEAAEELLSPVTAGLGEMTEERYFAYGSMVAGGWILGNPNLNGYQGFTAQQRDPSVTIAVWSTAAPSNPETSNGSKVVAERIAAVVSDAPFQM